MLEEVKKSLELQPLSQEDKNRGILGRLVGPIASCVKSTRNGRNYTEALWEKAFDNPIVKEMFKNGGLPGELNHPEDRNETDATKIAIMMPQPPKKDQSGQLIASVDILDTPCGKIAYQLAKYGFKLGISSRGEGDITEDINGDEIVDPDTYSLNAFDLVLVPACESARLTFTESLNTQKPFKKALRESIEKSSEEDQKIMEETLKELNIDIDIKDSDEESDIQKDPETELAGDDIMAETVKDLQESLKENAALQSRIITLQEQLSVCYAKETKLQEQLSQYKSALTTLSSTKKKEKDLNQQLNSLQEQLQKKDNQINLLQQSRTNLLEKVKAEKQSSTSLTESIESYKGKINTLKESFDQQKAQMETSLRETKKQLRTLQEDLAEAKKNNQIRQKEQTDKIESLKEDFNKRLTSSTKLVEHYKTIAQTAINKYVDMKALQLGITSNEIFNKLPKSYSFNDIDRICESLEQGIVNISKLPFNVSAKQIKLTEGSKMSMIQKQAESISNDDIVDESLINLLK